jgi:hypothetical protein
VTATRPGITDIKKLFACSGNRCAFPKCRASMVVDQTLIGEICHIKGEKPTSRRYDPSQTNLERHAYDNLVLMCPNHHTVIDDDDEAYTVERLHKIKASHEAQAIPIAEAEAAAAAEIFMQPVTNIGQSGGFSAHTVYDSTINVHSAPSTSHLTHHRQIQAVEQLWEVVRNLNREFSLAVSVDAILTASELEAYFSEGKHAQFADCIREYADMKGLVRKLASAGANDAPKERPFVTNRLWSVFFVLQGFYARTALLLANSYKEGRFVDWRIDSGCDQLLRAILPAHAVERAKGQTIGGLQAAISFLESQFLAEAGMNEPSV